MKISAQRRHQVAKKRSPSNKLNSDLTTREESADRNRKQLSL